MFSTKSSYDGQGWTSNVGKPHLDSHLAIKEGGQVVIHLKSHSEGSKVSKARIPGLLKTMAFSRAEAQKHRSATSGDDSLR